MGKKNFEKELDIFANCFINALIEKSAVDRQLAAIDSEFDLRKEINRTFLTIRTALFEKNHPCSGFHSGNRLSLSSVPLERHGIENGCEK